MVSENGFDSEYCNVKFIPEDNAVLLRWKKFCSLEDYRKPTLFCLELLRKYSGSQLIVDARNGFEDDKADVEWGFSVLLPEMSRTTCEKVVFIMNEVNDIEAEMDMWTLEFMKYFSVYKAATYEDAVKKLQE